MLVAAGYVVHEDLFLRHPVECHRTIAEPIEMVIGRRRRAAPDGIHLCLRGDDRDEWARYDEAEALSPTKRPVFAASLIATTAGWVSLRSTEMA